MIYWHIWHIWACSQSIRSLASEVQGGVCYLNLKNLLQNTEIGIMYHVSKRMSFMCEKKYM